MKRIYSIIALLLLSTPMLFGFNDKYESVSEEYDSLYDWDVEDVEFLRAHKDDFVGHEVGDLYKVMAMRGMKIMDVFTLATSPWIDKYGESYIIGLNLFSRELHPLHKGDSYYEIDITLDYLENETRLNDFDFWEYIDEYDDEMEIPLFIEKTRSLKIEKVEIVKKTSRFDPY